MKMKLIVSFLVVLFATSLAAAAADPAITLGLPNERWQENLKIAPDIKDPAKFVSTLATAEQGYYNALLTLTPHNKHTRDAVATYRKAHNKLIKPPTAPKETEATIVPKVVINEAQAVQLVTIAQFLAERKWAQDDIAKLVVHAAAAENVGVPYPPIEDLVRNGVQSKRQPTFVIDDIDRLAERYAKQQN